jgi:hypothetical protein
LRTQKKEEKQEATVKRKAISDGTAFIGEGSSSRRVLNGQNITQQINVPCIFYVLLE